MDRFEQARFSFARHYARFLFEGDANAVLLGQTAPAD
jgi:hypothetical protein